MLTYVDCTGLFILTYCDIAGNGNMVFSGTIHI